MVPFIGVAAILQQINQGRIYFKEDGIKNQYEMLTFITIMFLKNILVLTMMKSYLEKIISQIIVYGFLYLRIIKEGKNSYISST